MMSTGNGLPGNGPASFASDLAGRLLERRTLVIHEALTDALVARVAERLALLVAQPGAPVKVLLSLWGQSAAQGRALHDVFQSAHVQAVATGRVSGAGVVAFCGAEMRYALPGARFRLEEPTGTARGSSLVADAEEIAGDWLRTVALLAEATGQPAEHIERDVKSAAAFTAEEAAAYGLAARVVQSVRDVGE